MKRIISLFMTVVVFLVSSVIPLGAFAESGYTATSYRQDFVYTLGTQFMLNGKSFYYAGTNNYYINFKHKADVDNLMLDANSMGLKVVRTWGFLDVGTWTGTKNTNGYYVFNNNTEGSGEKEGVYYQYYDADLGKPVVNEGDNGLKYLDYAIYSASQHGIKLLVTFVNNWQEFGGMPQYCQWAKQAGETITDGHDEFYTNEKIKSWYKNYISTLLNRTNSYSGIKYKDDPAVFAWELANEPRCESDRYCKDDVVYNWAKEMSGFVKSIDPDHLVAVGDEGFTNYGYSDFEEGEHKYVYYGSSGMDFNKLITIPTVDFGTPHIYCDQWGLTDAQAKFWFSHHYDICKKNNKPVILEEFNWKEREGRAEILRGWFDVLENKDAEYKGVEFAGSNFWMLASLMEYENDLYDDYDGYTIYYRNNKSGVNPTADSLAVVMDHAEFMNSKCLNNSLSADSFDFDKVSAKDISFDMHFDLGTLSKITVNGKTLNNGTDYIVSGDTVTLKKNCLSVLDDGYTKFVLKATSGNDAVITGKIYDSTITDATASPKTADFYKNENYAQDIIVKLGANGRTFRGVYADDTRLTLDTDYTIAANEITLKKEFLTTLHGGENEIRFDFDRGLDPTVKVKVSTFKEVYECESDFYFGSIEGWEHAEVEFNGATCVRMRNNKIGTINIEFPADGEYSFVMHGLSKYKEVTNSLLIDGATVGTFNLNVSTTELTNSEIKVNLTKGEHTVAVQFADSYDSLNDYLKITADEISEVNPETDDGDIDTDMPTDIDTSTETESDIESDSETDSEPNSETESEIDSESDSETESEIDSEPDSETESEIDSESDSESDEVLGDINGDGTLDIIDVAMARAHIVGNSKLDDIAVKRGDMNADGVLDIIDVAMMRKNIVDKNK